MKISRQIGNLKLGNVETYQVFSFKRFSPLEARGVRGITQTLLMTFEKSENNRYKRGNTVRREYIEIISRA
jgi:hypothetical protein